MGVGKLGHCLILYLDFPDPLEASAEDMVESGKCVD